MKNKIFLKAGDQIFKLGTLHNKKIHIHFRIINFHYYILVILYTGYDSFNFCFQA